MFKISQVEIFCLLSLISVLVLFVNKNVILSKEPGYIFQV